MDEVSCVSIMHLARLVLTELTKSKFVHLSFNQVTFNSCKLIRMILMNYLLYGVCKTMWHFSNLELLAQLGPQLSAKRSTLE